MTKIVADNTNPFVTNCKHYGVQYLREIIYQYKIINNINITKTELTKLNKNAIYDLVNTYNIDIHKYRNFNIKLNFNYFLCDMRYMNQQNNINKPYKYRKLFNYFRFLDNY